MELTRCKSVRVSFTSHLVTGEAGAAFLSTQL
jgi:hypothetical protein